MRGLASVFRALSDETRLQMLGLLLREGELCVCDFVEVLAVTQSKASRHLATLKHAGLVTDRRDGLWSHYALRPAEDGLAKTHLALLRRSLADRPDAASLLKKLHDCLDGKDHGAACAKGATFAAQTTTKRHAGSSR